MTYRVAGFLSEVKHLVTTRSTLRKKITDTLHGQGIEIVSPVFMNQRALSKGSVAIPPGAGTTGPRETAADGEAPEDMMFDKANQAEALEHLRAERDQLATELKELKSRLNDADGPQRAALEREIARRRDRSEAIESQLSSVKLDDED